MHLINELIKLPLNGLFVSFNKKKKIIKDGKLVIVNNYIGGFIFIKILLFYLIINKSVTCSYFSKDTYIYLVLFIATELINTSIELLADYIQTNYDKKIGDIKDLASSICFVVKIFFIFYVYFYAERKCI